jgi:hypothetical protein
MVEVLNGINAGDLVVVSGQTSLVNNQRVRVTSGGEAAGGSTGASGAPQASPGASGKPQASGGGRSSGKPQASAAG